MLIEPQSDIISSLQKTYSEHPSAKFANIAISPIIGHINLYRIRTDLWRYYLGKIASGITSESKSYVQNKARSRLQEKIVKSELAQGNDLIESFEVDSMDLYSALKKYDVSKKVGWLQIDTEGYDDIVIYNSDIENTKPDVISYEVNKLTTESYDKLGIYLDRLGYLRLPFSVRDECAVNLGRFLKVLKSQKID